MSLMRSLSSSVLLPSCVALLSLGLQSCGGEPGQVSDSESVSSSPANLLSSRRGCGQRFVAPGGNDATALAQDNDCRSRRAPCATIVHAVDVACSGDELRIAKGEYRENVVVDKPLTLVGEGQGTVIRPAISSPNPCSDSSQCGGAASSVIVVRANKVAIHNLAIDGDNPSLTSGVVRGGADIDARNGIITDYAAGLFDALEVQDVAVKNIYHRGIYASSGGTFTFRHNRVINVAGQDGSVAIFNYGGAGTISDNEVDGALDAIASNHSAGVLMIHNRVRHSGSGLHTDNAGDVAGATADRIEGNVVSSCAAEGYGVWTFVPYVAPSVRDNAVVDCTVGLADFGEGGHVTPSFVDNRVDAKGIKGSLGALITTSEIGYGSSDVSVYLSGNSIRGVDTGVYLQQEPGYVNETFLDCNRIEHDGTAVVTDTASSSAHENAIARNGVGIDASGMTTGTFDASANWWGCAAGPSGAGCDNVRGNVDASSPLPRLPACPSHAATW